jgi:hypothetical protein
MNPKIKYLILITSLVIISCKDGKQKQEHLVKLLPTKQSAEKLYANPAIIFGSNFGSFFQVLYRTNSFETMLAFTSDLTLKHFERKPVLNFYQNYFKFDYKLGQLTNISNRGDTILLTYAKACIYGTRRKVIIPCYVENDSVKIIISSLSRNVFE